MLGAPWTLLGAGLLKAAREPTLPRQSGHLGVQLGIREVGEGDGGTVMGAGGLQQRSDPWPLGSLMSLRFQASEPCVKA